MKVSKSTAVALFLALKFKTAAKWDDAKLNEKLGKMKEIIAEGKPDGLTDEQNELIDKIVKANDDEKEIELVADDGPAEAAPGKKVTKAAPKKETKADDEEGKPAKAPKEDGPEGVRPSETAAYHIAGKVLKAHGHAKGVTKEMIADFEEQYGKKNEARSHLMLSRAWHVLNGVGYEG